MKDESLIGKRVRGFKFKDGPGYVYAMNKYIDSLGTITRQYEKACTIKFDDENSWAYPHPEILDYIEEEEQNIEQILNNIKNLTEQI